MIDVVKEVSEKEKNPIMKYPYMGEDDNGAIVLFTSEGSGILLHRGKGAYTVSEVGCYKYTLDEEAFSVIRGGVTIHNSEI